MRACQWLAAVVASTTHSLKTPTVQTPPTSPQKTVCAHLNVAALPLALEVQQPRPLPGGQ